MKFVFIQIFDNSLKLLVKIAFIFGTFYKVSIKSPNNNLSSLLFTQKHGGSFCKFMGHVTLVSIFLNKMDFKAMLLKQLKTTLRTFCTQMKSKQRLTLILIRISISHVNFSLHIFSLYSQEARTVVLILTMHWNFPMYDIICKWAAIKTLFKDQ